MNNEVLRQRFGLVTKATDQPTLDDLAGTIVAVIPTLFCE